MSLAGEGVCTKKIKRTRELWEDNDASRGRTSQERGDTTMSIGGGGCLEKGNSGQDRGDC